MGRKTLGARTPLLALEHRLAAVQRAAVQQAVLVDVEPDECVAGFGRDVEAEPREGRLAALCARRGEQRPEVLGECVVRCVCGGAEMRPIVIGTSTATATHCPPLTATTTHCPPPTATTTYYPRALRAAARVAGGRASWRLERMVANGVGLGLRVGEVRTLRQPER
eukprot:5334722-Prymnesium_polylepis.1